MTNLSFFLLFFILLISHTNAGFNVVDYGATPDGETDSSGPFLRTWAAACAAFGQSNIVVPKGRFYVSMGAFHGPCNSSSVNVHVFGSIVGHAVPQKTQTWLVFRYVDGLSIQRGAIDGHGGEIWGCKLERNKDECPTGLTTLSINHCKNVLVNGLTFINSQLFHIAIFASEFVTIQNVKIFAPEDSPNTDGIHVGMSNGITITNSYIKTGDDCISLGPGSTDVLIDRVYCGPGHGISIGSLAERSHENAGVRNVTVKRVVIAGTDNGFRIKTFARDSEAFVDQVSFRHAVMRNVSNPIIIDQKYCSSKENCPQGDSGVKITNVKFENIRGTSATPVAIKVDCSATNPCTGIKLKDVDLKYRDQIAKSFCRNAKGSLSGFVSPPIDCF
ncbi:polygalacturonase-like [Asparagus officinalis]|uniref:polygalacturonase-like n=1 Tax=Asparagus officinalis TaxID=4686 RepID=UPI00098E6849|nr:polygalacturonase-like [Asparagus officinalis]